MMEAWNEHPLTLAKWKYENSRAFSRDCLLAKRVVHPLFMKANHLLELEFLGEHDRGKYLGGKDYYVPWEDKGLDPDTLSYRLIPRHEQRRKSKE